MQYIMIKKKKKDSVLGNSMGFVQISECFTNENECLHGGRKAKTFTNTYPLVLFFFFFFSNK